MDSQRPLSLFVSPLACCFPSRYSTALVKHTRICQKVFATKRKAFNTAAQRLPPEALKAAKAAAKQSGKQSASSKVGLPPQSAATLARPHTAL